MITVESLCFRLGMRAVSTRTLYSRGGRCSPFRTSLVRVAHLQNWMPLTRHENSCSRMCLPLAQELRLQSWTTRTLGGIDPACTVNDFVTKAFCRTNSLCQTSLKCVSHADGCSLKAGFVQPCLLQLSIDTNSAHSSACPFARPSLPGALQPKH